ncbi:hypothetical protein Leryth_001285 [Lithospermum erythrorhizon]|nr:hypothetical protein Leryth_001285 [Lithospermum erythrorhizon]
MNRLYVYLLEGKEWPVKDSYLKLKVGKYKSKTRVIKNSDNPIWNEEFVFKVNDIDDDELVVSGYHYNEHSGFFNSSLDLFGRVKIPVWSVAAEEDQSINSTWFSFVRPAKGSSKTIDKDCVFYIVNIHQQPNALCPYAFEEAGLDSKVLMMLSLHERDAEELNENIFHVQPSIKSNGLKEWEAVHVVTEDPFHRKLKKIGEGKQLVKAFAGRLEKLFQKNEEITKSDESSDLSTIPSDYDDCMEEQLSPRSPRNNNFEALIEMMQSTEKETKMPNNLHGGVILDQIFVVTSKDLNMLLFGPESPFQKDLREVQGTSDIQEGPWSWKSEDKSCLTRVITYKKAATKLVKAVTATEEQTYLKANGTEFAIIASVSTPEVPYGTTFKVELLYKMLPGPEQSTGKESARLLVSWAINFHQNTMMKCMIEGGARQGLKENFEQFSRVLSNHVSVLNSEDILDKNHVLATLQSEHQSDRELAIEYFCNFTVVSTLFMVLYVLLHIFYSGPSNPQGLEFHGFDLPDSIGEIITSAILVLQLERVYYMISHFIGARLQRGSDHGIKSQGDGWVLTVALIEGSNLPSMDPTVPDPYVVLTCNGKTRTSSVQLQTLDPQWNEILEFDAAEEPPSVLNIEVFDFEGPFDQVSSLGHAEINFLKHTSEELADMWVSLRGKPAQSSQSKLHLRIFIENKNGVETIRDYLMKMEKEVGKKLSLRSPHSNSTFQRIFGLPPEEFLINDFSCSLKRRVPLQLNELNWLQGRLYLSARIVGFYANLFGHKTRFFFLWEDIEDIQVLPPSLVTVGSPSLVIILHKCRGLDARHGAKSLDDEGRLHFHFHSFVSFSGASRTIKALWRTRALVSEQKTHVEEEQQDGNPVPQEVSESFLDPEDGKMTKIKSLLYMFDGGDLEHKVMTKSGCLHYVATAWEPLPSDSETYERSISYKFNRHVSIFGGEVTSMQQKTGSSSDGGCIVNESMVLHDVPFNDHFRVLLRYQIEKNTMAHRCCRCDVFVGVKWLKSTKFQQRISRNIIGKFTQRVKEIIELVEREILLANHQ